MSNKDFKDAVQVLGQGFDVELKDCVEGFEGFFGHLSISIDLNDVGEEGRGDGVVIGLEMREKGLHERKVASTAEFEDECVEGRVRVAEIGLASSQVENFFSEERI